MVACLTAYRLNSAQKRPRREEPSAYPLDLYAEREPRRREPSQLVSCHGDLCVPSE